MKNKLETTTVKRARPLSPHLQVYSWQLTSVMSIGHRASGIALSFGTFLILVWVLTLSLGQEIFNQVNHYITHWFGQLILFGFSLALVYHLLNGIRHLYWDAGKGYELESVYKSGYSVIILTIILTTSIWYAVWFF